MSNYYRTAVIIIAVIFTLSACSKSYQLAFEQTEEIKKHGLVFRLSDNLRGINYLEKQGRTEQAKAEKARMEQDNRDLVQHFEKEFTFCPVRFYYVSQDT